MNRLRLGICDKDYKYASKMASYLISNEGEAIEPYVFSSLQQALQEKSKVDLCLTSYDEEAFFDEMEGKAICMVDCKREDFLHPQIEKYRSMSSILTDVRQIVAMNLGEKGTKEAHVLVVCSPISHELQILFSMCLCKELSLSRNTLYVNLRELSGFYQIFGDVTGKDFEDLVTAIQKPEIQLRDYINRLQEVDLLLPPRRPESFWEMDESMITEVLNLLLESEYENIVIDIGSYFPGSYSLLSQSDRIFSITRDGFIHNRIYQEWEEAMSFHYGEKFVKKIRKINLPLQSGGIKDSEFLLDELYRGNLGDYVREIAYE